MWTATIAVLALSLTADAARIDFADVAGEIVNLPGAPADLGFKMFGGYVEVGANGKTYFWFVESQSGNSATDPTLLWTNGGPGCSGLVGFLTEQGPFRPTANGTLDLNPLAWNKVANMVFIEQPVGVGFSVASNGNIKYGDAQAASDNYNFVKGFFDKFAMLKSNPFFITSESYGGHYMPTLAAAIVDGGGVPNFGGFMVGNPLTYMPYRDFGEFGTFAGHNLLPKPLWDQYVRENCSAVPPAQPGPDCDDITNKMEQITDHLDPYALDFPVCDGPLSTGRHERFAMKQMIGRARAHTRKQRELSSVVTRTKRQSAGGYFPATYTPCDSDWATTYLSRADVQQAIYAAPGGPTWTGNWSACSDAVGNAFSAADTIKPMMPVYADLIKNHNLKIMVYSGDDDSVCATLGTQQWVWDMDLTLNQTAQMNWSPWTLEDGPGCPGGAGCTQVAGYATVWEGLSFVTVHGAGHMVPATRPFSAFSLVKKFLADEF